MRALALQKPAREKRGLVSNFTEKGKNMLRLINEERIPGTEEQKRKLAKHEQRGQRKRRGGGGGVSFAEKGEGLLAFVMSMDDKATQATSTLITGESGSSGEGGEPASMGKRKTGRAGGRMIVCILESGEEEGEWKGGFAGVSQKTFGNKRSHYSGRNRFLPILGGKDRL